MPFVFLTFCNCPLVLKLQGELKNKWQPLQPYNVLTDNNAHWARVRISDYFSYDADKKVTGESVKFSQAKSILQSL